MYSKQQVQEASKEYFKGDELAANVFFKYALKDKQENYHELTPDDMHRRLAKEFARIESRYENPMREEEIYELFKDFKWVVPQGSPMYGIGNNFALSSLSNCVVVANPEDTVSSIVDSGKDLANLFKRRCGVGIDISDLRPENMPVNNSAGTTTGAWSFADFYSYVCRMIGQNGRRGALMISIDVRHPDVEKFAVMKHDLTKVTGANVSIRITDDFMKAVESDEDFVLHYPIGSENPRFTKTVKAKQIWKLIVDSATKTAEPGLLMWDNIVKNLPAHSYPEFKTLTTNPCGEIPLSAYDSCRLISVNLKHFVKNPFTREAYFDLTHFEQVARKAMRLSDDLIDLEVEKLTAIITLCDTQNEKELWTKLLQACVDGRRTGLGTHGLADAIARCGIRYDSEEGIELIDQIYKVLRDAAYATSVKMAKERGAFPVFDWQLEKDNEFIKRLPEQIRKEMAKHGRRNIALLTNAPTGSVSIESQTSSGIEPVFKNFYIRRRKLDQSEMNTKADFVDQLGDRWINFKVYHHNVLEYLDMMKTDVVPDFFVESDNINWQNRVKIQATIQNYIDHSISSTINLPRGTTPEVVGELYLNGWKLGLKGITVYVDGSRDGVLITTDTKKEEEFKQHKAPKRRQSHDCNIHHLTVKGEKWIVLIGLYDGKPYEVFGGLANKITIPSSIKTGKITKKKTGHYQLTFGEDGVIDNIKEAFQNTQYTDLTRLISLSLRHGADVKFVVEQILKSETESMTTFSKAVARVLKEYIKQGEEVTGSASTCPSCQGKLVYQDGCATCKEGCGWSKCY
jgi:ribonucleoside-diphosphate reductase alpha chain